MKSEKKNNNDPTTGNIKGQKYIQKQKKKKICVPKKKPKNENYSMPNTDAKFENAFSYCILLAKPEHALVMNR